MEEEKSGEKNDEKNRRKKSNYFISSTTYLSISLYCLSFLILGKGRKISLDTTFVPSNIEDGREEFIIL